MAEGALDPPLSSFPSSTFPSSSSSPSSSSASLTSNAPSSSHQARTAAGMAGGGATREEKLDDSADVGSGSDGRVGRGGEGGEEEGRMVEGLTKLDLHGLSRVSFQYLSCSCCCSCLVLLRVSLP
ncbi:unnamed protein product [Closterium sp. NIES-54]